MVCHTSNFHSIPVMMNFTLGDEIIRPVNDGSVEISYLNQEEKSVSWHSSIPVLSIEVAPRFPALTLGKTTGFEKQEGS